MLNSSLRAMSMNGLVSKNYPFPEKKNFSIKLPTVLGMTFVVSNSCSQ